MSSIRRIKPEDLERVRELDAIAFTSWIRQTGRSDSCPCRTVENVQASLALDPEGCFIAEEEDIRGFVFSRVWGKVGWLGTFAVHPDHQGKGLGQLLLNKAIGHLKGRKCGIIGLETMPESPYNVGLYTRFGFRPFFPTLTFVKSLSLNAREGKPALINLSEIPFSEGLSYVSAISQAALPGLDYRAEVENAKTFAWGETFFSNWPQPWAFALIRTQSRHEARQSPLAEVSSLAVRPEARQKLKRFLSELEYLLSKLGFTQLRLPLNSVDWHSLGEVLSLSYKVQHVSLRMILQGDLLAPSGIDFSRWAM